MIFKEKKMADVEGQNPEQEPAEQPTQEIDVNALLVRVEQLESTNQRLLQDSKAYKNKAQGYRSELEKKKEESLVEKKDWDGLLAVREQKIEELNNELVNFKKTAAQKELQVQVARFAGDAHDLSDVFASLPQDRVAFNDNTMQFEGVAEAVKALRNQKPYLFKGTQQNVGVVTERPTGEPKEKTFEELSASEQNALFIKALGG